MKKILLPLFVILCLSASAQVFWTENFGTGCSQGTLASGFVSSNGTWNVTGTGTNGSLANVWYVSAAEAGMGVGACGDGCLNNSGLTNRTLHVGSNPALVGDVGAAYFAGPGLADTDVRAESPVINCTGRNNISFSFNYIMEGSAGYDFAGLAYYDGSSWTYYNGSAWTIVSGSLPASNNSACSPQGTWTAYSVNLPASANNNPNVKIGFRWSNNNDGVGADPSFAVDDITLNGTPAPACSVSVSVTQAILCNGDCNGALLATATGTGTITYWWNNLPPLPFGNLGNLCAGTYTITITDQAACSATATFTLTEPPLLTVAGIGSSVPCNGDCTGSASVVVSGGTPGYNYLWSDGSTTAGISNLCAGVYTVTISDANNCSVTASFTIIEPPLLVLGNLTPSNPTCAGCPDGSICIGVSSGGTPPYTHTILPPLGTLNGNCYINLPAGIYTVCIADANGCTACSTDTLTDPPSGIENLFSDKNVLVYPNPFTNETTIEIYNSASAIYRLLIRDAFGRNLQQSEVVNNKFEITFNNLPGGIYFIELHSHLSQILWRGKVLKQ